MPSSTKQQKPPSFTTRVLEIAQRLPLFLSPDRQPFVICPSSATATPIYAEAFYAWLTFAAEKQLGSIPSPQQIGRVIRQLDNAAHTADTQETVHTRTAKIATKTYQIDLGLPDHTTVEVTGKQWRISQFHDARFQRLETSDPLPIPEPSLAKLHKYFELMYGITEDESHKLAQWLGQAMLPDQKPPILVITGEARDEAITQLRTFIDPAFHATIYLPTNRKELAQQAIENRVLAYVIDDKLPEQKIKDFNKLRQGMDARLRHASKKSAPIYTKLHRPIIFAAEKAIHISNQQLTIEINKTRTVEHAEILGPILDVVVQIVGQPITYPEPLTMKVASPQLQQPDEPETPDTS